MIWNFEKKNHKGGGGTISIHDKSLHISIWKCENTRYRTWRHHTYILFPSTKRKRRCMILVVQRRKVVRYYRLFHYLLTHHYTRVKKLNATMEELEIQAMKNLIFFFSKTKNTIRKNPKNPKRKRLIVLTKDFGKRRISKS